MHRGLFIPIFKFFVLNTRFRLFCSENNSIFAPWELVTERGHSKIRKI
nr:MAG TPA: hypothetical protein [Caudoviricetes sp.]